MFHIHSFALMQSMRFIEATTKRLRFVSLGLTLSDMASDMPRAYRRPRERIGKHLF